MLNLKPWCRCWFCRVAIFFGLVALSACSICKVPGPKSPHRGEIEKVKTLQKTVDCEDEDVQCDWVIIRANSEGRIWAEFKTESLAHKDWRACQVEKSCPGAHGHFGIMACNAVLITCPEEPIE